MIHRSTARIAFLAAVVATSAAVTSAFTAANSLPGTHAGNPSQAISPGDLKPSACAGVGVTDLATGSGSFAGGSSNDLMLGSAAADTVAGSLGNDCIVGGAADDEIDGGGGTDVCIGGPGTDTFFGCETEIQ